MLGVFLLTCSVAFAIAGPTIESVTDNGNDSSSIGLVSDQDRGSEKGIEFMKMNSENVSDIFYQTPGDKFYVSKVMKTWDDAAKSCETVGMELASITSRTKQLELVKFLFKNDLEPADDFSGYWLSGYQLDTGLYNWTPLNKHMNCWGWLPGEPSHIDDLEHCVELKLEMQTVRFGWNNLLCEKDRRFICQKKKVIYKDTNQPEEQYQETDEELQTSCFWFYNPRSPTMRRNWESEGYIRLG